MAIVTIGLDLAKSVFHAHGVDETGATALTKRLHRKQMVPFFSKLPRHLIAMEACGTAHYWAHVRRDGERGPPHSALLCEGLLQARQERCVRRPGDLRSGAAPGDAVRARKDCRAAGILMAHRARSLLVRQRTMLANALRAHLAELGLVANKLAHIAWVVLARKEAYRPSQLAA